MPLFATIQSKIKNRYQRSAAKYLARRPCRMRNNGPLISFTFDDFPRSALFVAGKMLESHGFKGTYYTSLGLMGQTAPTGEMFHRNDLSELLARGHELACHTFAHCHSYDTLPADFEQSIIDNRQAIARLEPGVQFKSLSYPISWTRPETKRRCAPYFLGCRAGGQSYNTGVTDLNYLNAFFIEQNRDDPKSIKAMIDENRRAGGWLIFATHDVCTTPTRYGCTPELFKEILDWSIGSGARILPVSAALEAIGAGR